MTTLETVTLATAIIGACCGSLGVALGIINTWQQVSLNRVNLRVIPKLAFMLGSNQALTGDRHTTQTGQLLQSEIPFRLCVEVINLSAFPVTISDIGFGRNTILRAALIQPELSSGKSLPVRLESRESITAYMSVKEQLDPKIVRKPVAYAMTDCKVIKYGSSPIFKDYMEQMKKKIAGNREGLSG